MTWAVLSWRSGAFSLSLSLPLCHFVSFFFGEGFGGKEVEVPRLDGRTLHFGAGKCRLGTGLGRRVKAEKPSSYHIRAGCSWLIYLISHTHTHTSRTLFSRSISYDAGAYSSSTSIYFLGFAHLYDGTRTSLFKACITLVERGGDVVGAATSTPWSSALPLSS